MTQAYRGGIAPKLRKMMDDPLYQKAVQRVVLQRPDQSAVPQTGGAAADWMGMDNARTEKDLATGRAAKQREIDLSQGEQKFGLAERQYGVDKQLADLRQWQAQQQAALERRQFDTGRNQNRISTGLEVLGLGAKGLAGYGALRQSAADRASDLAEAARTEEYQRSQIDFFNRLASMAGVKGL